MLEKFFVCILKCLTLSWPLAAHMITYEPSFNRLSGTFSYLIFGIAANDLNK